jgi:hypothetical protein
VYKTLGDRTALQEQFGREFPGLIIATDDLTIDV